MDAITAMTTRRSIRKYTSDPVKPEDLETILNCGRLAPTGVNRQAWKFIVATDQKVKDAMADATDYGKFINQAAVVVAVAIGPEAACPFEDAGAAACNMLGAYCGARYAMKGGSKRVRGMIFVVLGLLFIKMGYELLF